MKILCWLVLAVASFGACDGAAATDYEKAAKVGLPLGKNQYSDDVRQYLASVDAAFDKHDYTAFGNLMRNPGNGPRVLASLDWAHANMLMGSSVIVPIMYAESLWSIGSKAPAGSPYENYKETAAFVTLYSLAVIAADGPQCADQTAPNGHFPKVMNHLGPVIAFLKQLPEDKKKQVVDLALNYEAKASPLRKNDNYLCRFGMEEIGAGLKAARPEDLPQRPPQGNEVGTQVSVPSPPGFEPKYVEESIWRPKQVEMRQKLPAILASLAAPLPAAPNAAK